MGMSASQARFLSLTARKTNVEFEGQQINQQRTTLSNESANYYSKLASMSVPTPPSSADYTKTVYTFTDGSEKNTINSLIATTNGTYILNYTSSTEAESVVSNGNVIVTRSFPTEDLVKKAVSGYIFTPEGSGDHEEYATKDGVKYQMETLTDESPIPAKECALLDSSQQYWYFVDNTGKYNYVSKSESLTPSKEISGLFAFYNSEPTYLVGSTPLRTMNSSTKPDDIAQYLAEYGDTDPYLKTIVSEDDKKDVLFLEATYAELLQKKYNQGSWLVRYQKNSSSGAYEPIFYNKDQVEKAHYDDETGASQSGIKSYVYGHTTETREVKNAKARVEQDTSGRYISIFVYDLNADGSIKTDDKGNPIGTEYNLTARTQSDDRAYNDAMNQYNYNKAKYDQDIQAINAKIEIIQGQDKDLELRLKQLDTEENAISTEIDAVKKVISKNVENSFKTFNA